MAQSVWRGITLLFHDPGTRRGESSAARPGCTLPPGKTRYPFYRRLGGSQGQSGWAENLVPTGIFFKTCCIHSWLWHRSTYWQIHIMAIRMTMVNAVDGTSNLCWDCSRATVDNNSILQDQVDPRTTWSGGRTVNYIRQSMARESMSLRPNSLKVPIIHISIPCCEAYYFTWHISHVYDMESPDKVIRITIDVHSTELCIVLLSHRISLPKVK